jgi:hypothetical protein
MENGEAVVPRVTLPERVDRRIRLGPFPSARDALKFVCYAAVGAVLSPFVGPTAWLPVVALGFAVSVWRPDGDAWDERAARRCLFQVRRWVGGRMTPRGMVRASPGSVFRLSSGRRVTIVRAAGTPLAYRPPADLATLFERFRELLRATEGPIVIRATSVSLRAERVVPPEGNGASAELAAREGYTELISVLCRRRRSRRVEIALGSGQAGPEGRGRLEDRARSLAEGLATLGLPSTVLEGRPLAESARTFGWVGAGDAP